MNQGDFLPLVQQKGSYGSQREASRAATAVFGTIKSWISPAASRQMRKLLPLDAASLWQCSPVSYWSDLSPAWSNLEFAQLVLKVQQAGKYDSSGEALAAYESVMGALRELLPVSAELVIGKRVYDDSGSRKAFMPKTETIAI